jgi:hypothetical protein
MGISFSKSEGKAKKGTDQYKYKEGENSVRIFGEIMPRYVYWLKSKDGKDIPVECLGFDREKEKFTNIEKDWVQHYFPHLKCGWAYAVQAIDLSENKVVLLNLKKKLFEQIKLAAEDLGDPTDLDKGWPIVFKRVKTGNLAFNVEYTLQVLKCKNSAVTEEQRKLIEGAKHIDEVVPRNTSVEQKEFIEKKIMGESTTEEEVPTELQEEVEDIPL